MAKVALVTSLSVGAWTAVIFAGMGLLALYQNFL
jgi:uncharacterized membrane protein